MQSDKGFYANERFSMLGETRPIFDTPACRIAPIGEVNMDLDLDALNNLVSKRADEIEDLVAGTGYLPRTVIGVATFLLDNHGDTDLLTAKQQVTFEKFIVPLLKDTPPATLHND